MATSFLLSSCDEKPQESSAANPNPIPRAGQSKPGKDPVYRCKSIEALEVLGNGDTVLSRLNENSWVAWSLEKKEAKAKGLSLNYGEASREGSYLWAQISPRKYQLLKLEGDAYRQNAVFALDSVNQPSFKFGHESRFLMIRHRPYRGRGEDRVDLYNINKKVFAHTIKGYGIKFFELVPGENSVVIGADKGYDKFVAKYDLETGGEVFRIKLPLFRAFTTMKIAKDRILVKSRNSYFVYSAHDGELLYQSRYEHFYEVDPVSGIALAAKGWKEAAIVDLSDGREVFAGAAPAGALLSSCRIGVSPLRLVCKDKVDRNKILTWDFENGEVQKVCY